MRDNFPIKHSPSKDKTSTQVLSLWSLLEALGRRVHSFDRYMDGVLTREVLGEGMDCSWAPANN